MLALGTFGKYRPRLATTCVLHGATLHKLQRNLQLAVTYAVLGSVYQRPSCEPRLQALVPSLASLSKRYLVVRCYLSERFLEKFEHDPGEALHNGKTTGNSNGPASWVFENHQAESNSVEEDSDMALICWFYGEGAPKMNNSLCQHFCWEKGAPPALTRMLDISVPPFMSLVPCQLLPSVGA